MEFFDFGKILLLIEEVIIFIKMRNVIGSSKGKEKKKFDNYD